MTATGRAARTRFDRMVAKSEEQARAGNLPRLLRVASPPDGPVRQVWSVGSRTVAGEIRIVEVTIAPDGRPTVACDCPATGHCWHQVHVLRALNGEVPYYRTPERTPAATQRMIDSLLPALAGEASPGRAGS